MAQHLANHDFVVAAVMARTGAALEYRGRAVQHRQPRGVAGRPSDILETVLDRGGEAVRKVQLVSGEHIDHEARIGTEHGQAARAKRNAP